MSENIDQGSDKSIKDDAQAEAVDEVIYTGHKKLQPAWSKIISSVKISNASTSGNIAEPIPKDTLEAWVDTCEADTSMDESDADASPRGRTTSRSSHLASSPSTIASSAHTTRSMRGHSPPSTNYMTDAKPNPIETALQKLPRNEDKYNRYYTYKDIKASELRLLRIAPGDKTKRIECALKIVSVERINTSHLKYQALSYAWEPDPPAKVIYTSDISDDDQSEVITNDNLDSRTSKLRPFLVRSNLFQALRSIRNPLKSVWIWVDAICINQSNDSEKNHQLPKMGAIFARAWNVTIWLGDEKVGDKDCKLALQILPQILDLRISDTWEEGGKVSEDTVKSWVAFAHLLQRSWFSRRWVIQEIASAKRASIRIGDTVASWIDFADAVELFNDRIHGIRAIYKDTLMFKKEPDALSLVESSAANALVTIARSIFRKTDKGGILYSLLDLETLVFKSGQFSATDARDVIYALVGIANDRESHSSLPAEIPVKSAIFTPDYSKPHLDVYSEFFEYVLERSSSLDVICRHWALPYDTRPPPSWIGLAGNSTFGASSNATGRINGVSLVGDHGHGVYNASRGMQMQARLGKHSTVLVAEDTINDHSIMIEEDDEAQEDVLTQLRYRQYRRELPHLYAYVPELRPTSSPMYDGKLYAKGIILGQIAAVSARMIEAMISQECLKLFDKFDSLPGTMTEELWQTLVAGRGPDGKAAPSWYRRACAYVLTQTNPEGDLNVSKLIDNNLHSRSVIEFLKRVQAVVWSRKLFRYAKLGSFSVRTGLASRDVLAGDYVCVLFGCSVPVILRRQRQNPLFMRGRAMSAQEYRFISECYIHGYMDGEAFLGWRKQGSRTSQSVVEFCIV
ncbi:heterokaryon incompatibility protein-domain-containing protein [Pyrenochaeta sp. MPI-SDFR-AT-0127]|nr:heterokaryon incompatibility protein-domain-containing protein [Pyrenochaeta sp. MPI-SDFR-AT-0127]